MQNGLASALAPFNPALRLDRKFHDAEMMTSRARWKSMRMASAGVILVCSAMALAAERSETFDKDPGWDGHNNRATSPAPRTIRQDFGYSSSNHAGGAPGEIGGFITPAAEPAYYARKTPTRTFNDPLSASGVVVCAGQQFHVLVGFFNAQTLNEWRTPNTIALRLQGRGDHFYAYVEYTTSRWRAGGDSPGGFTQIPDANGRLRLKGFPNGSPVHRWSLRYDPEGNGGTGTISVALDDETAICHLDPGHKADGATFDRFGLLNVMKQADTGGDLWLDDITINGERESFDRDPGWDALQNRRTYTTNVVRPRFDFGYSEKTHHAGGHDPGEMGGLVFRGDGRFPNLMAFYGDRLEELSMTRPLKAAGKVSLRRAVSDSDVLLGFFHAERSLASGNSDAIGTPPDFLGVTIGGPSRGGFMFSPAYRLDNTERKSSDHGPYLLPNGASHDWTLEYLPGDAGGEGSIMVTLDGERVRLSIPREHQALGAHFNRFGLISTHTDGNGQHLYFDDLTYTWTQAELPAHRTLRGHTGSVMSVAFAPDGKTLASGCRDKTIRLWDTVTGELQRTLEGHEADVYSVAFAPDGQTLASGSGDHTIRIWDLRTNQTVRTVTGHTDIVRAVAFSSGGQTLASGGVDAIVRLWDTRTWQLQATLTGHQGRVKSLAFSPDGRFLVSAGDDKSVRVWNVAEAVLAAAWPAHNGSIETVLFSPDGKLIATSSEDSTVRIWRTGSWTLLHTLEGHRGEVDSIAFARDGHLLASGSKDRTLKLWDPQTGALRRTLAPHSDRIESLTFSPSGELATGSGGKDATIKLWNLQ